MLLRSMSPMLETKSIEETIRFYTSVLGFIEEETFQHERQLKWCCLAKDSVVLMFSIPATQTAAKPVMTGTLYFYPDNIDELWESVKGKCDIAYPIENFSYGMREFAIRDNNGYILAFGAAIQRSNEYDRYFPPSFTLETPRVLLRLLNKDDFKRFVPLASFSETWKYFTQDLSDPHNLMKWMNEALAERAACKRMPFTVIDKHTHEICGSTSYGNISFYDKRIEIGWTWLAPSFMGTGVNRHAKFALLSYAFEVMKMERVEIKTDNLNERAKAALLKVGMKPEGILRSHMQMHSNRRRDSIYFSMIKPEWEERKILFFSDII